MGTQAVAREWPYWPLRAENSITIKRIFTVIVFTVTEDVQVSEKKTVNDLQGEINTAYVLKLSSLMSHCS